MSEFTSEQLKAMGAKLTSDIDNYCAEHYAEGHRTHMGMSHIGSECMRQVWLSFRWAKKETIAGRMRRLLQRGKDEEKKIIKYLRGKGWFVYDRNPDGSQQYVNGVNGHYGGSPDAVIWHEDYKNEDGSYIYFLLEIKTSMTGSPFNKLEQNGMAEAKPQHFVQGSNYGRKLGLKWGVYACVNKNDDTIYWEFFRIDYQLAEEAERTAEDLINSQVAPAKISQSATNVACRMCHFGDLCHRGQAPEKNCRSCRFAKPVEGKQWLCEQNGAIIPKDFIPQGCGSYERIV